MADSSSTSSRRSATTHASASAGNPPLAPTRAFGHDPHRTRAIDQRDRAGTDRLLRALLPLNAGRLLRRINEYLVRWAMRKYKRLRRSPAKTRRLLAELYRREPGLFAHWRIGARPDGWTMGAG